jgi:hypothetical protein
MERFSHASILTSPGKLRKCRLRVAPILSRGFFIVFVVPEVTAPRRLRHIVTTAYADGHSSVVVLGMRRRINNKQACECNHGKTIHYAETVNGKIHHPCHFPDCNCKDYKLPKP